MGWLLFPLALPLMPLWALGEAIGGYDLAQAITAPSLLTELGLLQGLMTISDFFSNLF